MSAGEDRSLRERIFARDRYACVYCGAVLPFERLTLDHVQPRMRGGDNSPGNLVTACAPCNTAKGSRPAWDYLAELPEVRAHFLEHAAGLWPRLRRAVEEGARK